MAEIAPTPEVFDLDVETLIVGGGAAGLVAALAAHEAGQDVLVVEADPVPRGSTALSAGLIPAAGTRLQDASGIDDSADAFAADIQKKARNENDAALVTALAAGSGPLIDWLTEAHGLPFSLVDDFDYPGHSVRRMHGLPTRAGRELIDALRARVEALGLLIASERRADILYHSNNEPTGVRVIRPDGGAETIGCAKLILACNGFGGNRRMVAEHMPDIDTALWFGHDGNRGEAVLWGAALGAETRHLGAYQGHGNVAHPHGILITWAVIGAGGVQVNSDGQRFWDESQGYSEAARAVLAEPGGVAFSIFDAGAADIARQFEDFKQAEAQGAVVRADTLGALATALNLPAEALEKTIADIPDHGPDRFGRVWTGKRLAPPYCGVRVTGALFHTQGGLRTDGAGRVQRQGGGAFDRLFAAGGAACGVSGSGDAGYLSGNGLLAAVVLGRAAGSAPV